MFPRIHVFLAASLLALGACKKADAPATGAPAAPVANSPVDPATAGSISGKVTFSGTAPAPQKINMAVDPGCRLHHKGDTFSTDVVVNPNRTLRWVIVYVKSGLGDLTFPVPTEPAVLDQKGCLYEPHVLAVQAGQTISIKNSDPVLHNVHAKTKNNPGFNIGQPIQGMVTPKSFPNPEVAIPVSCDVHPWMLSWIAVLPHPYASVTDDTGEFTLSGLPPGEYEIEAWHEKFGTSVQKVKVATGETTPLEFVFKS